MAIVCNSVVLLLRFLAFILFFFPSLHLPHLDARCHFQKATTHDNLALLAFIAVRGCQRLHASNWCRLLTPLHRSLL